MAPIAQLTSLFSSNSKFEAVNIKCSAPFRRTGFSKFYKLLHRVLTEYVGESSM